MIAILLALLAVVNVPNNSVTYACNGVTAVYSVNFPYLTFADLKVTSTTTGGAVTTLAYTTDYTVNFVSTSSTATLTLTNPAVKCPNTNVLKIARNVTYTQPYSFKAQSVYNQGLHELAYDRLEMQIQQLSFLLSTSNTWTELQIFNKGIQVNAPSQSLILDGFGAASFTGSAGFDFFDGAVRTHDGLIADIATVEGTLLAGSVFSDNFVDATGSWGFSLHDGGPQGGNTDGYVWSDDSGLELRSALVPLKLTKTGVVGGHLQMNVLASDPVGVSNGQVWLAGAGNSAHMGIELNSINVNVCTTGSSTAACQSQRGFVGCTTAASVGATCTTVVSWPANFANTNYMAICTGALVTSGVPLQGGITAKAVGSVTFQTVAATAAAAKFTTIECFAMHD